MYIVSFFSTVEFKNKNAYREFLSDEMRLRRSFMLRERCKHFEALHAN